MTGPPGGIPHPLWLSTSAAPPARPRPGGGMAGGAVGYKVGVQLLTPAETVADLLSPYRIERVRGDGRCWVLANMVGGLDGSAAVGGRVGALSHGPDAELFRRMRAVADVVLVGAETVRREGYGPVRLPEDLRQERVDAGRTPTPPVAVVTRSLDLDWSSALFTAADAAAPTSVITCESADPEALARARAAGPVMVAGWERVDLGRALDALADQGHAVVLTEGGPALLGLLVADGLLDELCLTVSPLMGGDPLPVAVTPPGGGVSGFDLRHVAVDGSTLFLRYEAGTHGR
jgi:riboflavin biosynthesis pyrimidine reductase